MILIHLIACTIGQQGQITETGNPERNIVLAVFDPTPPDRTETTIDSAWASFQEFEFELEAAYGDEHELEWEVEGLVADLAAGPVPLPFESPSLGYDHVEIRPRHARTVPTSAPPQLGASSFVIAGTRADGVAFQILANSEEDVELDGGFELSDDAVSLALGLDLDRLLLGVDLGSATPEGGEIRISEDANPELLAIFEANLATSFRLVIDVDGDGELDDGDVVLVDDDAGDDGDAKDEGDDAGED